MVVYSGAASGSVTADSEGNFVIDDLAAGDYLIVPALAHYVFTPESAPETISDADITDVDFAAAQRPYGSYVKTHHRKTHIYTV